MKNNKFFITKMSDKIVEKFPDPVNLNSLFEVAQAMLDQGKEPKEIKKILKDLYGASKDEIARMEEKLFKNKINAAAEWVLPETFDLLGDLKTVLKEMDVLKDELGPEYFITVAKLHTPYEHLQKAIETLEAAMQVTGEEVEFLDRPADH